jgi:hypothetical protein
VIDLSFTSAPDPFSTSTVIAYTLARRDHVTLTVYSLDGELVRTLVDAAQEGDITRPFSMLRASPRVSTSASSQRVTITSTSKPYT